MRNQMDRGLMYQVDNPFAKASNTLAQSGVTTGGMTKKGSETKTTYDIGDLLMGGYVAYEAAPTAIKTFKSISSLLGSGGAAAETVAAGTAAGKAGAGITAGLAGTTAKGVAGGMTSGAGTGALGGLGGMAVGALLGIGLSLLT